MDSFWALAGFGLSIVIVISAKCVRNDRLA
jgi:hypothetical protein